jgi:hypothetical protein
MQKGAVHGDQVFVANRESTIPREPRERPLDDPPMPAQVGLRLDAFARDAVSDAARDAFVATAAIVVALVGVQLRDPTARPPAPAGPYGHHRIEQWREQATVMDIRRGYRDGERDALAVGEEVVLRAGLPLVGRVAPDIGAPLFAGRLRLSTAPRLQSIRSAAARRSSIV